MKTHTVETRALSASKDTDREVKRFSVSIRVKVFSISRGNNHRTVFAVVKDDSVVP